MHFVFDTFICVKIPQGLISLRYRVIPLLYMLYIIIKNFTNLVTKKCSTFIGCKDRKKSVQ